MSAYDTFKSEGLAEIDAMRRDVDLHHLTQSWIRKSNHHKYSYHFEWLGRPLIQYPQDVVALQECIYEARPDLIIETGIAHGGSLVLSASLLALLDYEDAVRARSTLDPAAPTRKVLGIDIDIRAHNRAAIDAHPMRSRIEMLEGSSVSADVAEKVRDFARRHERVMVLLDSNHTHEHVRQELELYAPLVTPGSFCIVFDTIIEDLPADAFPARSWGRGNNPKTAVWDFLKTHPEFAIDRSIPDKLQITVAPDGFLRRLGS